MTYEHRRLMVLPGQRFMLGDKSSLVYCDPQGVIRRDEDDGPVSQTLAKEILARPEMVTRLRKRDIELRRLFESVKIVEAAE